MFDMSTSEASNKYLEGTGALVPDRVNGIVYVNLSERADEKLAQQWADSLGYKEVVTFRSAYAVLCKPRMFVLMLCWLTKQDCAEM